MNMYAYRRVVDIHAVETGMVDCNFGPITDIERIRPDATRITYANGYRRVVALGGRIYVERDETK